MEKIIFDEEKNNDEQGDRPLTTSSLIAFIFAFIAVELYFISPIYFIFKYNKKYIQRKHLPILQIFLNLLNCSTYVIISLMGKGDFQNLITNSIGVVLCLIVVFQLWFSLSKIKNNHYVFHFFFVFNIIIQIYYILFKYIKKSSEIITIIINIFMYLSLNIGTYYAFKEKRPDRIPILSAVLGLLSSIGWTLYAHFLGELHKDKITLLSNSLSIAVTSLTVALYIFAIIFKKFKKNRNDSIKQKKIDNDINKIKDNDVGTSLMEKRDNNEIDNNNDDE